MDFSKIRNFLFIALLAAVTIVFVLMIKTFAYPIFWAAIIAGVFYPLYRRINKSIKVPNLSTIIIMALVLLVIVLPLFFVGGLVVKESVNVFNSVNNNRGQIIAGFQNTFDWLKHNPYVINLNLDESFWADKFTDLTKTVTNFLFSSAKALTQNSLFFIIMLAITFYALFFFIRDGEKLLLKLMHLCPLGDEHEKMLYRKFTSTVRAVLRGQMIVGLIQGALGGIMFAIVGIQGAILWAILMAALSIFPFIGSYFVWVPAAIAMLATGKIWQGIFIIAFGFVVIHPVDNILRPILVGKDTQMHPLLVLLSTLGGIAVFGISGFIIGPIIAALMLAFWEMYEHFYKNELDNNP